MQRDSIATSWVAEPSKVLEGSLGVVRTVRSSSAARTILMHSWTEPRCNLGTPCEYSPSPTDCPPYDVVNPGDKELIEKMTGAQGRESLE